MSEKIYYENGNLLITASRIVIDENTYAVSSVTAVRKYTEPKATVGGFIIAFIAGFFTFTITWWAAIWKLFNMEPTYEAIISISSGEEIVYKNKDEHVVDEIIARVNQVIIDRQ